LVVPEDVAARLVLLVEQGEVEADRLIRLGVELRGDRDAGARLEGVQGFLRELLVLGAVEHDARPAAGTTTAGEREQDDRKPGEVGDLHRARTSRKVACGLARGARR